MELYRKHRPDVFEDVKGQDTAVNVIRGWFDAGNVPHAVLLEGPSGVGKTTLARIFAKKLGADTPFTYCEVNASAERGVEMVSQLLDDVRSNISGGNRVWVLDEVQGVTKSAQNSLLKLVEDCPSYAYFVFCTTDPQKLLPTLTSRFSRIRVSPLSGDDLRAVIGRVCEREGRSLEEDVVDAIVISAEGSARTALVLAEQCLATEGLAERVSIAKKSSAYTAEVRDLCKVITDGKAIPWATVGKMLDSITEEPEKVRRAIMTWLASALTKGWAKVSYPSIVTIMRIFQFDLFASGKPGLCLMVREAWEIVKRNDWKQ